MKLRVPLRHAKDKVSQCAGAKPRISRWVGRGVLCFACLVTGACRTATESDREPLVVYAASSVADVLREIADRFESSRSVSIVITQGSSGSLCKRLELGAPCDVFLPADRAYLDRLQERDVILGATRRKLAGNELVIVRSGADATAWTDPNGLLDVALGRISVASPDHAPAGRYAREALKRAGLWDRLTARMVHADNVRFAARYVADGAVQVGIVYATDALAFAGKLSVVYRFGPEAHGEIVYEAAVCTGSTRRPDASAFVEFAASEAAGEIWRRHGFARDGQGL